MVFIKFIVFVTLILSVSSYAQKPNQIEECCEDYCYELDSSRLQYKRFATKTPYELVKGHNIEEYRVTGKSKSFAYF